MNFDLSEDEELLKALAERFVVENCGFELRRASLAGENGFSARNWALLGELGLIAAPFAPEDGGLGLNATAIATIFEALGRGLAVEPLIENVLVAARLFAASADNTLREQWLANLLDGSRRIALAHAEKFGRPGRMWVSCQAKPVGRDYLLSGVKDYVIAGGGADGFIVSARVGGDCASDAGLAFFFVPADAEGLEKRRWRLADGSVAVSLALNNVAVPAENRLDADLRLFEETQSLADLARSAEALGIMEQIFGETRDYLVTREQFGVKLGSLQAIQHRMVAQYAAIEQARALLNHALVCWNSPEFGRAVSGLRAFIGPASIELGHEMIQFHGGMGVSDELSIGLGHKRLLVLSRWPESPEIALDRFAGLG